MPVLWETLNGTHVGRENSSKIDIVKPLVLVFASTPPSLHWRQCSWCVHYVDFL